MTAGVRFPLPQAPKLYRLSWHLLWNINPTVMKQPSLFTTGRPIYSFFSTKWETLLFSTRTKMKNGRGELQIFHFLKRPIGLIYISGGSFQWDDKLSAGICGKRISNRTPCNRGFRCWQTREQYLPTECQHFLICHLNCKTLWNTVYKTLQHTIQRESYSGETKNKNYMLVF